MPVLGLFPQIYSLIVFVSGELITANIISQTPRPFSGFSLWEALVQSWWVGAKEGPEYFSLSFTSCCVPSNGWISSMTLAPTKTVTQLLGSHKPPIVMMLHSCPRAINLEVASPSCLAVSTPPSPV